MTSPSPDGQRRAVWMSAGALSLALTGDQLLYVVLPLAADSFGVSLVWVGILLSANRWIRVALYGEVARIGNRIGPKRLTAIASFGAIASTLAYALLDGGPALLIARIVWGLSFAALNLTTLAYAIEDESKAGRMVGLSRAIREVGPILAATIGAWLATTLGPREAFLPMALLTALAIPMAWAIPSRPIENAAALAPRRFRISRPSSFNLYIFAVGLAGDGVFTVTIGLLFLKESTVETAMLSAGAVIALRHVLVMVASPVGGVLADRFGANRTVFLASLAMVCGFALVPFGLVHAGALLMLVGRGILAVVAPIIVARRIRDNALQALSANATWADLGAAIGPLLAGFGIGLISLELLYAALAVLLLALLLLWAAGERG